MIVPRYHADRAVMRQEDGRGMSSWRRQDRWRQVSRPDLRSMEEGEVYVHPCPYMSSKGCQQIKVPIDRWYIGNMRPEKCQAESRISLLRFWGAGKGEQAAPGAGQRP